MSKLLLAHLKTSHGVGLHLPPYRFKLTILCYALSIANSTFAANALESKDDTAASFKDYVTQEDMAKLPEYQRRTIPTACRGVWITPIPVMPKDARIDKTLQDSGEVTSESDYAYYDPNAGATLTGNVIITQPERIIQADKVTMDATQTHAVATGNVHLSSPGVTMSGDTMNYDLSKKQGAINNTHYISEERQAHGKAGSVTQPATGITILKDTEYSTCDPLHRVWNLRTKTLTLNKNTGRGVTKNTTLYIQEVPVLKIPYFDFPIDDRRATGFLNPTLGLIGSRAVRLSTPYYINLAPNYDLTLTPTLISDRNALLEGNFRYLTSHFGQGSIDGSFLHSDVNYNHQDRERASLKHDWQISPQTNAKLDLNYVSDKDYFVDLGSSPLTTNTLYPERTFTMSNSNTIAGLDMSLKIQDFQTEDHSIYSTSSPKPTDSAKPYTRLPQLLANYQHDFSNGWQYKYNLDSGYFKKHITDGSAIEDSGVRLYNQLAVKRNFNESWGYFSPELSLRTVSDYYNDNSLVSKNLDSQNRGRNAAVPQITLDQGLTFERPSLDGGVTTLEPRLMYSYAPYTDQSSFPNYDTTAINFDYNQMFQTRRFIGHDRIEDNNFMSVGLTHRGYSNTGIEKYRVSIGEREFFQNRQVYVGTPSSFDKVQRSGPAFDAMWQPTTQWHLSTSGSFSDKGAFAQSNSNIQYRPSSGNVINLGYIHRNTYTGTTGLNQISSSFQTRAIDQWNILGYAQYDIPTDKMKDRLLGFSYDACCWRVAMYGRSFYLDNDDLATAKAHSKIMLELTLKGLGGLSGGQVIDLLKQKIAGYY